MTNWCNDVMMAVLLMYFSLPSRLKVDPRISAVQCGSIPVTIKFYFSSVALTIVASVAQNNEDHREVP